MPYLCLRAPRTDIMLGRDITADNAGHSSALSLTLPAMQLRRVTLISQTSQDRCEWRTIGHAAGHSVGVPGPILPPVQGRQVAIHPNLHVRPILQLSSRAAAGILQGQEGLPARSR